MLSTSITDSQQRVIRVPKTGKDKKGKPAKIEGPATIEIDPGSEGIATVELDPNDPSGMTLIAKATVTEDTPGDGPWLVTGTVFADGRVGPEVKKIPCLFAIEVRTGDAGSFDLTADEPTEVP